MLSKIIIFDQHHIFDKNEVNKILATAQRVLGVNEAYEIELHVIDDLQMRLINYRYRGINQSTDVLSFVLKDLKKSKKEKFVLPDKFQNELGQIFISHDKIIQQSRSGKISPEKEALTLLVHGLLHLFGFDHKTSTEEKRMKKFEKQILN